MFEPSFEPQTVKAECARQAIEKGVAVAYEEPADPPSSDDGEGKRGSADTGA